MPPRGEQPSFSDIIRPPETPEEQWAESARLAASIMDANGTGMSSVITKRSYEEAEWIDPDNSNRFFLRRHWSVKAASSDRTPKPMYYLRVHYGNEDYKFSHPSMIYVLHPELDMEDDKSLQIKIGKKVIPRDEWCEDNAATSEDLFSDVYAYLRVSERAYGAQLSTRQINGELIDFNQEFAKLVLGEAVVAGAVRIDRTKHRNPSKIRDTSQHIARSVVKGKLRPLAWQVAKMSGLGWLLDSGLRKSLAEYESDDTSPRNWRLREQALAGAIAESLRQDEYDSIQQERPDNAI